MWIEMIELQGALMMRAASASRWGRYHCRLCLCLAVVASPTAARADDWPQWLGPKRDGVWRETGLLDKFPKGGPTVRWRAKIGGGYSGPAVADGRVYLTDWVLSEGNKTPKSGFNQRSPLTGKERVLCLDDADGHVLWKHEYESEYKVDYPAGPRAAPLVHDSKVYTLGAMGDLLCLDSKTGRVIWSKNFVKDYEARVQAWGFAGHPLMEGDKLICLVGGEGSTAVAFHKDTGKELWRALSAREPGYCGPEVFEAGGKRQLIVWHPEAIDSLDPETGKVYWSEKFEIGAGMTIPTPRKEGDLLYFTCFYSGSMMLKLAKDKPSASILWKGKRSSVPKSTDELHSTMSTPVFKDGHIYGVSSYGEFRCLKAATGEKLWQTFQPTTGKEVRWGNVFIVAQEDRYFLFNENG